jgi:hypothetical protein
VHLHHPSVVERVVDGLGRRERHIATGPTPRLVPGSFDARGEFDLVVLGDGPEQQPVRRRVQSEGEGDEIVDVDPAVAVLDLVQAGAQDRPTDVGQTDRQPGQAHATFLAQFGDVAGDAVVRRVPLNLPCRHNGTLCSPLANCKRGGRSFFP